MRRSQIRIIRDEKKRKHQQWFPNMYCSHPIHTTTNRGLPVKITEKMYNEKHCMSKKCQYLFIDKGQNE